MSITCPSDSLAQASILFLRVHSLPSPYLWLIVRHLWGRGGYGYNAHRARAWGADPFANGRRHRQVVLQNVVAFATEKTEPVARIEVTHQYRGSERWFVCRVLQTGGSLQYLASYLHGPGTQNLRILRKYSVVSDGQEEV